MVFYLLTIYAGKTIVFVNSIHTIRRLVPILTCLKANVFGLHAEMQQKQRLKNLERFTTIDNSILIASDIAARGLDIPSVDMVIHYQIPRSGEIYVHRSGRTGRLNKEGVSIVLTAPEDQKLVTKLCSSLNRPEFKDFPVNNVISKRLKEPLRLATEIDLLEHSNRKKKSEKDWFKQAAENADLEYSDDDDDDDEGQEQQTKQFTTKLRNLKSTLQELLLNINHEGGKAIDDLKLSIEQGFTLKNKVSFKKRKLEMKSLKSKH